MGIDERFFYIPIATKWYGHTSTGDGKTEGYNTNTGILENKTIFRI